MRISDWSSDVCSSDLHNSIHRPAARYPLIVKTKGIINTHTENYNGVTFFTRHKLSNNSDNISLTDRRLPQNLSLQARRIDDLVNSVLGAAFNPKSLLSIGIPNKTQVKPIG